MRFPALPAGAFIAAFLILIPASWLWRAGHVHTLSLIAWLFVLNIVYGVNSLVWSDDAIERVPIWCDISTKLMIGASTALPACNLCISKHLAMIGGGRTAGLDRRDLRRIAIFDFGFCWGVPVIFMVLHYIVQGHRYNNVQYIGCQPTVYTSIPGVFIIWVPPLLLSVVGSVYAGIALRHFVRMRRAFSSIPRVSSPSMSPNGYVRLIAMSTVLMIWGVSLTSLTIWANTIHGLRPWVSWERVHSNWNRADAYVWVLMDPQTRRLTLLFWWAIPVSSVIAFLSLGFGEDATREYRRVGEAVMRMFSYRVLPKWNEKFAKGKPPVPPFSPSGLSFDGSSAQLLKTSTSNQTFQELPPIQIRSLQSMIGLPRSRTQSQSSGKSCEWRWSMMDEKPRPSSLELDGVEGGLDDSASGMRVMTITEPPEVLTRGSVQGRESHDQV